MFCGWCRKDINGIPEIRELGDSTLRPNGYFVPLHKKCVRRYERLNQTWKLEKPLSEMMAYLFVHLVPTYAGGYTYEPILWVI